MAIVTLLALQFTSPGPTLVEIGPLSIRWYGLLIASAVLLGISLSSRLARRRDIDPNAIADLAVWLVIGAIPAARLYYVAFEWQQYASRPAEIFAIWHGGIAIHGAILGGTAALILFARRRQIPIWQLTDVVVPSLALGQAIGRWGNFFNSEAFGTPTDLPWKLFIPIDRRPLDYIQSEYFHPTFLYESLWNLLLCLLLIWLFRQGLRQRLPLKAGVMTCIYLIGYSLGRIWIEGLRTDSLMLGSLRIAQMVSIVAIAFGVLGLVWIYGLKRSLPDVVRPALSGESRSEL
ncbi:prolipoprotein diacylglyceryl transferase [Synechococcus elongatus]|uniref:prolipoprotein diacylglyceryl transferase n=1 Tax=Synechococcus elongatus TaxID=32046 RepID=UPI000F7EF54B|nr:prolipoprotein diacylglyceryl transferase [Synechococcus elongatus]